MTIFLPRKNVSQSFDFEGIVPSAKEGSEKPHRETALKVAGTGGLETRYGRTLWHMMRRKISEEVIATVGRTFG